MKTIILGVVYPNVTIYLKDYFRSLELQTDSEFDSLIIEDNSTLPKEYQNIDMKIIKSEKGQTPADIRMTGISYAIENGYKKIIFSDCDDYYSINRIERSKTVLECTDIYINNLTLIDENKAVLKNKIFSKNIVNEINTNKLIDRNFFGLSNSAVSISSIPENFYIPSEIIAVDWWIFTILLLNKKKYKFDKNAFTYYRQHGNNIAGLDVFINKNKLMFGIKVKELHYKHLIDYCKDMNFIDYGKKLMKKYALILELKNAIKSEKILTNYLDTVNINYSKIKNGWWSEIISLEELNNYE